MNKGSVVNKFDQNLRETHQTVIKVLLDVQSNELLKINNKKY
jgi:hypothetical protein